MSLYAPEPILKAILGSTNTGKTHYAVERMLGRSSGCIGLPLRLLAREIYDRIVRIKGPNACALITGEEKIIPRSASYFVCTVEAMPTTQRFAFVAIDEVQLAAHPERGHIFTDRILNMRGTEETLFLGSENIRPIIRQLVPKARHETRERFSQLSFAGATKLRALPKRSVIVAFSAGEVYRLAEVMRRERGGAAVVMGGLSPRTRNAQAELYQNGEVDYLIATDAIGMGLNLDADHVAFAALRKFDGRRKRFLNPPEVAQIAGRAGRFRNDGTFGTTGACMPMDEDLVGRIESHMFDPVRGVNWRNSKLDMSSTNALLESLNRPSPQRALRRTDAVIDELSLDRLLNDTDVAQSVSGRADVMRLWEVCQIPDFRDSGLDTHVRLLYDLYDRLLKGNGTLPDAWLMRQVARLDHIDGTIETLSQRLMQIRTWTYVANKSKWLIDAGHWQARTRTIEDRLSDALHERLIAKFVDRRTRALMKGLGAKTLMDVKIDDTGSVSAEGHTIGTLKGLQFSPDENAKGAEAKALSGAAAQVVAPEVDRRMMSMTSAQHDIFTLTPGGIIKWGEADIAKLSPGKSILHPVVDLIGGDLGQTVLKDGLVARLGDFIQTEIRTKLAPLKNLEAVMISKDVVGDARGFAFQMLEVNGLMQRRGNEAAIKALETEARSDLRGAGIRFGEYFVYMPELIKPAASELLSILHAFSDKGNGKPFIPFAGVTSVAMEPGYSEAAFNVAGYSGRGPRIVRVDILNRLGDTVRQAKNETKSPKFFISLEMMAMLGTSYEECAGVLKALGYKSGAANIPVPAAATPAEDAPKAEAVQEGNTPAADDFDAAEKSEPAPIAGRAPAAQTAQAAEISPAAGVSLNTIGSDGKAKHAMPNAPKPKKKKKPKGPQPLAYYEPIISQDEAGKDVRGAQTEFWFMPFRKPAGRPQNRDAGQSPDNRSFKPKGAKNDSRGGFKGKGGFKGGPKGGHKKPQDKFASKKPAMKPEDSPFAALAALNLKKD